MGYEKHAVFGGDEKCVYNFNGKSRNDETLWTRNHMWEDNINMELKLEECFRVNLIGSAQGPTAGTCEQVNRLSVYI
jgi:hypothetical protein